MEKENYKIYMHQNKINGKVYVGQTKQSLRHRWNNGYGYIGSPYFYHAIQKYGWDNFEHILLEDGLTKEKADEREQHYIQYYNSCNQEFGYNISKGGSGLTGATKYIDIYQYSLEGYFIKHYKEISNILQEYPDYSASTIRSAYDEIIQTAYGYQWKSYFKEKIDSIEDFKDRVAKLKGKVVYKYDLFGNFICSYDSVKKAATLLGIGESGILKTCHYQQKSYMGYQWKFVYAEKIPPVEIFVYAQYDVSGSLLNVYNDLKEATDKTNIGKSTIINCYSGRYELAGGYVWKRYNIAQEEVQDNIEIKLEKIKLIALIDEYDNVIKVYHSAKEAAKDLGFKDAGGVIKVCEGLQEKTHGYRFRYC